MNIGESIKRFRKLKGMEQKDLASLLGVSNRTISSWETNRTEPKMEMIDKMCAVFGCRRSDFLHDHSQGVDLEILMDDQWQIVELYSRASPTDKKMVDSILYKYSDEYLEVLAQMRAAAEKISKLENMKSDNDEQN